MELREWQRSWRLGIVPELTLPCLEALEVGLRDFSKQILQRQAIHPHTLPHLMLCEAHGCCPIGYALWKGLGLRTVGEVYEKWREICDAVAKKRRVDLIWWFNFWDATERLYAFAELLTEVRTNIADLRAAAEAERKHLHYQI